MRSCMSTLLVFTALLYLCIAVDIKGGGRKGDDHGWCTRNQKGAEYGTDIVYRSPDNEGCCESGFRNRDNRCVGCPRGLHYTKCKHECTLYCDPVREVPFLNCSQLSYSFFDECDPGCVCPPGQYESVSGECVFLEEVCDRPDDIITASSNCTDPLMVYSQCHSSCASTCRNFLDLEFMACAAVCYEGCRCKEGYVYDEFTNQCTLPANCTALPTLPQNAVWGCCEGDCEHPYPTKCESCKFGAQCKSGYVRDEYRNCVDLQYCLTDCSQSEIFDECPFESTCLVDNSGQQATTCVPGCRCRDYYVRDLVSGACILSNDCPVTCTGAYEIPGCSDCDKSCGNLTDSSDCSSCQRLDTCVCDAGYARNDNGVCVRERACSLQCDASRNLVQMCSECVSTCDVDNTGCVPYPSCFLDCGCSTGLVLNTATGECVPPTSCPVCTDCVSSSNLRTYKQEQCLPLLCHATDRVTYTVRFVGTWESSSHPDFGFFFSHWSPLTGASHKPGYEIWENCYKNVTEGVRNVAEKGNPRIIFGEYDAHPEDVLDTIRNGRLLRGDQEITVDIDVNKNFHYVTLLSMMGDTKDYMVGVDRLDMCDDSRFAWKNRVTVCLKLYSTGTKTELADGCAAHSRQFTNCSFGYIELTKKPKNYLNPVCAGQNEVYDACDAFCDTRCEYGRGSTICPRICLPGCVCADGYARDDRDECVLWDECPGNANQECDMGEWNDFALATYPNDTVQLAQVRFVTRLPTGLINTCQEESLRFFDYCGEDDCNYFVSSGCAVWIDTCYMETKCGTTDEYDQFMLEFNDDVYDRGFFEPSRTHGSTTVGFDSLSISERFCDSFGTLGQHTCRWNDVVPI